MCGYWAHATEMYRGCLICHPMPLPVESWLPGGLLAVETKAHISTVR